MQPVGAGVLLLFQTLNSLVQLVSSSSSDFPAFLQSRNVESSKVRAALFPPFAILQSSFDSHDALFDLKDRAFPLNNVRNHFPVQVILKSTTSLILDVAFLLVWYFAIAVAPINS